MEFWGDDRGQSVQIGAVLLFGFLVIALTTYQTTVVPQQNAEVEYNHNQAAQLDMLDLRNDLLAAGRTGRTTATTVQLGTRYPARAVFINPPPPSGRIETVGTNDGNVNVSIGNATADGAAGSYWDSLENAAGERSFDTGAIVYSPNYNQYRNAPDTGIDIGTGVVFNAQQDARIPVTDQQLIEGNRINLLLLAGNLSKGGSYATALDARPVSSSENTIRIRSGQNVTITLATRLGVEQWEELTRSERQSPDGRVLAVESAGSIDEEFDRVRLVLKPGSYRLSVSKIGVGTVGSAKGTAPAYLTAVSGDAVVNEGTEQPVRFELRDELNNPTGGEAVTVSVNDSSLGCLYVTDPNSCGSSVTVDADGHDGEIEVQFRATDEIDGSSESVRVEATFGGGSSAAERANVDLTVVNTDGSGTGNGDGGDGGDDLGTAPNGDDYVAFNDKNGNGEYDQGEGEDRYTAQDLESYSRSDTNLVLAKSISSDRQIQIQDAQTFTVKSGAEVSSKNQFKVGSGVGDVTIRGTVESTNNQIEMNPSGTLDIGEGTLRSKSQVKLGGSDILAGGATIESEQNQVEVDTDGTLFMEGAFVKGKNQVKLVSDGSISAKGAVINSTGNQVEITGRSIDLRQSTVRAKNNRRATLTSENTELQVNEMLILDQNGNAAGLTANVDDEDQVTGDPQTGWVNS